MNSPHKGPVTGKVFSSDDVIMKLSKMCRYKYRSCLISNINQTQWNICWSYTKCRVQPRCILNQSIFHDNGELSWCQLCHHWRYSTLSWWQPAVLSVATDEEDHMSRKRQWCEFWLKIKHHYCRTDLRLVPSHWETLLQSSAVSHWLGANLESALLLGSRLAISKSHQPQPHRHVLSRRL